jgi:chromosome segregation ATPase
MTDIVERLRRVAKELPQTSGNQAWLKPEDTTAWEAADEIEKLRAENAKLAASNHTYLSDYQEAAEEIEKLRAAMHDLAGHVWRGDWDKLKPETRELLGEKQ